MSRKTHAGRSSHREIAFCGKTSLNSIKLRGDTNSKRAISTEANRRAFLTVFPIGVKSRSIYSLKGLRGKCPRKEPMHGRPTRWQDEMAPHLQK